MEGHCGNSLLKITPKTVYTDYRKNITCLKHCNDTEYTTDIVGQLIKLQSYNVIHV